LHHAQARHDARGIPGGTAPLDLTIHFIELSARRDIIATCG
jgi:hypothetical protein